MAAFFCVGAWAVAAAGRHDDRLTLPAAMGSYLVKIGLLGLVVVSLPTDGPIDTKTMAVAVLAGTVTWVAVQVRSVWTKRLFYVDHGIDRGIAHGPAASPADPAEKGS